MATVYRALTAETDFHTDGEVVKIVAADQAESDAAVAAFVAEHPEWRVVTSYTERGVHRELSYSEALAGERSGPDILVCAELVRV